MRLKTLLPCIVSLALVSPVWAVSPGGVARIRSTDITSHKTIESSGVVLRTAGRTLVVTSAYGILEEPSGASHVLLREGAELPLHAVKIDWGTGLAALEAAKDPGHAIDLDTLKETPLAPHASLGIALPSAEVHAKLVQAESRRHTLPFVETTHEILSDLVDASVAGAPVFGPDFLGIASHQYLRLVPGAPSRLEEWKPFQTATTRRPLVIPLAAIRGFLSTLERPAGFFQRNDVKLAGTPLIEAGRIAWRVHCPDEGAGDPGEGGPIGGPIGGGEGVGVGGEAPGTPTCALTLSLAKMPSLPWPFPTLQEWHDAVAADLAAGRELEIASLLARDAATGRIARLSFRTLSQFFTLLRREGVKPTVFWSGEVLSDPTARELKEKNAKLRAYLEKRYADLSKEDAYYQKLLRRLYFLTSVLDSTTRRFVTARDLREAKQSDPDIGLGWINLEHAHKEDYRIIGDGILELADLREKMGSAR